MKTELVNELNNLKDQQSKIAKKIGLLEELLALEGHAQKAKPTKTTKRVAVSTRKDNQGEKQLKLPELLEQIGQEHTHPMKYEMFAKFVQESGYQTSASNLNNMVYQCLRKLVKKNIFQKNADTREYQYVGFSNNDVQTHTVNEDSEDDFDDKPNVKKRA
jgi:hypothetical protein